jgi:hypothetical protein
VVTVADNFKNKRLGQTVQRIHVTCHASQFESASFATGSVADGFHEFGVQDVLFPGSHGGFFEGVVVVSGSIASAVAFERVPEIFDGRRPLRN